ncbi:hypothetical protein LTR70_006714, partial [Exophiala xenobiotica]
PRPLPRQRSNAPDRPLPLPRSERLGRRSELGSEEREKRRWGCEATCCGGKGRI